ncbi:MAG: ATPase, T2SS/T4P/T4SS family [Succinivibrio sp.]
MHSTDLTSFEKTIRLLSGYLSNDLVSSLVEGHVDEIMLNPDSSVFVRYSDGQSLLHSSIDEGSAQIVIRQIASLNHSDINEFSPIIECEIADLNARFSAVLPPLCRSPIFCLRSLHALSLSLDDLLASSFITKEQSEQINRILKTRQNIVICGPTGCGKTSFINSLLKRISVLEPESRIICIEDTPELKVDNSNCVSLVSNPDTSLSSLLKATLRLSPDRIVVGEVRSEEALDLVDALSTGHCGSLSSVHAGSVEQCMERLRMLISKNPKAPANTDRMIASAVNAVIVLSRSPTRHVSHIARITGYEKGRFEYEYLGDIYE